MHDLPLISTVAAALTAALVLGLITQKFRLSPIVGYLLAGIAIGPHTPGFVGDVHLASQLAELGVILLMFGVGLHFHLEDLLSVRNIAVPGAIGQALATMLLGAGMAMSFGLPFKLGMVLGMSMAVASTVVLIRVLTDFKLLETTAGHIAVGWLIVEDILTVVVLVLVPALGSPAEGEIASAYPIAVTLLIALLKLSALVGIVLLAGSKLVPWIMVRVARLRSRELFTLTVLVMALAVATGSAYVFGASMALGAFLAGMVVGQSPVSQQAAADALPMRDAFAVLFFTSVGMVFDPRFVLHEPLLLAAGLAIVLIGKPLAALLIVAVIGYSAHTALIIALGLAQIGEFSFILSELAHRHGLMSDVGHNLLVACAIISITLNPILFRWLPVIEARLQRWPRVWQLLNRRAGSRELKINDRAALLLESEQTALAIILGYGPVGRAVDGLLRERGMETVVIDLNMETVEALTRAGRAAIFGDAYNIEVMSGALQHATHLIITLPHVGNRNPLIVAAKLINPEIKVFVRARYIAERAELEQVGADGCCYEEAEAAVALSRLVLRAQGLDEVSARQATVRIRRDFTAPRGDSADSIG